MLTTIEREEATATFSFMADDHVARQTYLRCEVEDVNGNVQFAKHCKWRINFDEKEIIGTLALVYVHHGEPLTISKVRFFYRERQIGESRLPGPFTMHNNETAECSRRMEFQFRNE